MVDYMSPFMNTRVKEIIRSLFPASRQPYWGRPRSGHRSITEGTSVASTPGGSRDREGMHPGGVPQHRHVNNCYFFSATCFGKVLLSIRQPTKAEAMVPQRMPSLASFNMSAAS